MGTKAKNKNQNTKKTNETSEKNSIIMKTLVFFGVIILGIIIVYLMYYFFVKKSDIKINMSTDKQMEYITVEGEEEMILTQKYVSDLEYSMRYDISKFKVFKYKEQDIYKNLDDERVLVLVEKSTLPNSCDMATSNTEYNDCYIKIDNYTDEHYISNNNKVYKITIKTPGTLEYEEGAKSRINYMIKSFAISN